MITPPTAPAPGKPVSASFFGSLIRWVKSRLLIAGVGYRLRTTPNGTVLELDSPKVGASASVLPWSFSCTEAEDPENPGETVRTGGWDNCRLQVGLDTNFYSSWRQDDARNRIKGTGKTDDGQYFVKVNLSDGANPVAEIVAHEGSPVINYEAGTVEVYIGTVSDGKLDEDSAPHFNPVIWKYL